MSGSEAIGEPGEAQVTVRYWAAARAAMGVAEQSVSLPDGGVSVAELLEHVVSERARGSEEIVDGARVARVVAVCSVLVDEHPVQTDDLTRRRVGAGAVVDLLPPFAGG